jgi:hypothetical protein
MILDDVPGLEIVDLVADDGDLDARSVHLRQFADIHIRYFPGHEHVIGEVASAMDRWPDPEVVVHPWLLLHDGQPVGEYVFHTNLRRGIVLMHFLAADRDARHDLIPDWRDHVTRALEQTARADAEAVGRPLLGLMGEIPPDHYRLWSGQGFRPLDVEYREPHHGRHWAEYGELEFFPMLACIKPVAAGIDRPFREVAAAGLAAFLVDHYLLPRDEPTVARAIDQAALLPDLLPD